MHKQELVKQALEIISWRLVSWNKAVADQMIPRDHVPQVMLFYADQKKGGALDRDPEVLNVALTGLIGAAPNARLYAQEVARAVAGKPKPKAVAMFVEGVAGEGAEPGSFTVDWLVHALNAGGDLIYVSAKLYVHDWKADFDPNDIGIEFNPTSSYLVHAYRPYGVVFEHLTDVED